SFDIVPARLRHTIYLRSDWNIGAYAGVEWQTLDRDLQAQVARAGADLAAPPVAPLAFGQINDRASFGVHDGHDEQVWPEEVFVVDCRCHRVVRVFED